MPVYAILVATLFGYGAIVMSYLSPDKVFAFLVNSYGTVAIFVYILIAISQLRLRYRLEREAPHLLKVRMWCFPFLTWLAIFGMLSIVVAMAFIPEQRTPREADWARVSAIWQQRLEEQIDQLVRIRDDLSNCIGCGCLSFQRCLLVNPADHMSAEGPGPRRFAPGLPRPEEPARG